MKANIFIKRVANPFQPCLSKPNQLHILFFYHPDESIQVLYLAKQSFFNYFYLFIQSIINQTRMSTFKRMIRYLIPPENWRMTVIVLAGIFFGIFALVLHASNFTSYLSDESETCINCHVMYPFYASWSRDTHSHWASCGDCHVPQDNFISKYYVKARDGFNHSTYFTFRWEPQVIRIKDPGRAVVQENCIRCHQDLVETTQLVTVTGYSARHGEGQYCWECHRQTPHGEARSLSSTPHSLVETLPSVIPDWLQWSTSRDQRSARIQIPGREPEQELK